MSAVAEHSSLCLASAMMNMLYLGSFRLTKRKWSQGIGINNLSLWPDDGRKTSVIGLVSGSQSCEKSQGDPSELM